MKWFSIVSAAGLLIALTVQLQGPYRGWISSRNTNNAKSSSKGQTPPATSSIKTRRLVQDLLQQEDVNKRANAAASVVFLARNDAQMLTQMRREGVLHALAALIIGFEIPTREKHMTMSKEETKDTIEAVTASLVALALLSAGEEVSQGILMNSGLLPKVLRLMKTELGGWLAASSQLLYSLSKGPAGRDEIQRTVDNNAQWLAILAVRLLEGGAAGNSTDAMISSCRLMALLVGRVGAPGHAFLESQDTTRLMLQVLGMHHGKNGSTSDVVGALLEPLDHMIKDDNTVLQKIGETGSLRFIVQELRPVPRPGSAYAALSLMLKAANTPAGAEQLISGGVLSACSQIYYLSGMEPVWRRACLDILADITETRRYHKGFSSEEEEADEEEEEKETVEVKSPLDLDIPADSSIDALEDMRDPCPEGALFITGIMMKLLSKYIQPGLHLSALQAMRDVAHSPLAAQAIVTEGALQAAVNLIGRNLTKDGLYPPDWAAQVHRESVLLVAMLALRTEVKDEIVQAGAIEALCTCMTNHLKYDKDMGSVRMTAAAALVPILGSDDGLIYRAVKAGALNALLPMLNSPSVKEQEVSGKILEVLTKDPDLINKLDLARTAEQAFRARQAALEERGQV